MPAAASSNKAYLLTEDNTNIPCLFNPGELELHQANGWAADIMPGKGVPTLRYTGAASGQLHLNLFFDTTDTGTAVTTYTSQLLSLMAVDSSLPGSSAATNNARPPWVVFHWGDFHSFKAVVSKLELTFDYFASDGTPLRASADLVLTQYQEDMSFGPQNPTSGTPRPHRTHQVQPGETLDRISAMHLGDSGQWRSIAELNGIEDPLDLRPGSLLAIPGMF
jgi:LysM repeat protein